MYAGVCETGKKNADGLTSQMWSLSIFKSIYGRAIEGSILKVSKPSYAC